MMREDPPPFDFSNYDEDPDSNSLSSKIMKIGHIQLEKHFTSNNFFSEVLEVGAGYGGHCQLVKHGYNRYTMTDWGGYCLGQLESKFSEHQNISIEKQDATCLTYPSQSFDRLIACHVLEHLADPHKVLREWHRVVKKGGVISILLPTDPGVAWRTARIFARKKALAKGMEYDYIMAREHINAINNLVSLIRYYFDNIKEQWSPLRIPSMDVNLFYCVHISV